MRTCISSPAAPHPSLSRAAKATGTKGAFGVPRAYERNFAWKIGHFRQLCSVSGCTTCLGTLCCVPCSCDAVLAVCSCTVQNNALPGYTKIFTSRDTIFEDSFHAVSWPLLDCSWCMHLALDSTRSRPTYIPMYVLYPSSVTAFLLHLCASADHEAPTSGPQTTAVRHLQRRGRPGLRWPSTVSGRLLDWWTPS